MRKSFCRAEARPIFFFCLILLCLRSKLHTTNTGFVKGDWVLSDSLNHRFTESYRLFLPRPSPLLPLPQGGEGNKSTNPSPYSLFVLNCPVCGASSTLLILSKIAWNPTKTFLFRWERWRFSYPMVSDRFPKQVRDDSNTGVGVTWFDKVLEILRPRVFWMTPHLRIKTTRNIGRALSWPMINLWSSEWMGWRMVLKLYKK